MTRDMTEGATLPHIIRFSLPLLLGNLFQQLYNMVDAAIVGRVLGAQALASVGASSSVQFLVLGFCIGCACGFAIPVAQRFGAHDLAAMRGYIFHASVVTAVIAVLLTVPCAACCHGILHLLRTPQDIYADAYDYLFVIFLGIPFCLLYNLLSGILRAVGDSRTPFVFLAVSAVLNIVLDLVCILVLGWGCMGAAVATVASQAVSGILCLLFIIVKADVLHLRREECALNAQQLSTTLMMGLPMGLQYSITAIGSMVLQGANNSLGSVYVSAFTAAMKLKQFAMCPFDALATAVSTFAGQNYGAHKTGRIRDGIRKGVAAGVGYGIFIGLVLVLFGRSLTMLFVSGGETAVLDAAGFYLRCLGCFYWAIGILNVCRMTTQGLGFSNRAIFSGVTEMFARILVSLAFVPRFGFSAISFADQTAWLCAVAYIVPTLLSCLRKIEREVSRR